MSIVLPEVLLRDELVVVQVELEEPAVDDVEVLIDEEVAHGVDLLFCLELDDCRE